MSAVIDTTPTAVASRWRGPLLALGLLLACLLLLYRDTLLTMVGIWYRSETFAHCFMVPLISGWLAWRSRDRLRPLTPAAQPWLLLAMVPMALLWWLSDMAGVNAGTQLAFTVLLILSVPAVLGMAVARVLAFPLLFLLFMVPVGEFLLPLFMEWTADFTVAAIALTGIPVYREGLNFVIPSGSWSVVEACSGVRYMIASFMVGSLFAYLNYRSLRRRLIFCAVSLLVPLVANWLRAYMIVMLGHLSGNKLAVGVDHLVYGWVFFGVVIGLMFMIGARWTEAPAVPSPAGGPALAPSERRAWVAVAAAVVLAAPHAANWQLERGSSSGLPAPLTLPQLPGASAADSHAVLEPRFANPSATAMRHYAFEGDVVTLHVAWYRNQGYGRKLVSSQNVLVSSADSRWRRVADGTVTRPHKAVSLTWLRTEIIEGHVTASTVRGARLDVRQIYWVDGRFTASGTRATLYGMASRLRGAGDDGAMLSIYTRGDNAAATAERLDRFLQQHLGAIEAHLAAYRAAAVR